MDLMSLAPETYRGAGLGAIIGAALGGVPGALAFGVIGGLLGLVVGSADKKEVVQAIKEPEKNFFQSDIYYRLEADVFDQIMQRGHFQWESGERDGKGNVEKHLRWANPTRPIVQFVIWTLDDVMSKVLDVVNSYTDDTEKVNQILNEIEDRIAGRLKGATAKIEDYDNLGSWYDLNTGLLNNDNPYLPASEFRKVTPSSKTFADRAINQQKEWQKNKEAIKEYESWLLPEMYEFGKSDEERVWINELHSAIKREDYDKFITAITELLEGIKYRGWLAPHLYDSTKAYRDAWVNRYFNTLYPK